MPIWPFNLIRRKTMTNAQAEPLTERSRNLQPAGTTTNAAQPSRASSAKRKRGSRQLEEEAEQIEDKDAITRAPGKENIEGGYRRQESIDEITALPVKWKLEHSPHLRPVDSEKAAIPYNFQNAGSHTSITRTEGTQSKPGTLRSKRSTVDGTPTRWKSSKKRPDARLREEEIRAMSATMPKLPETSIANKRASYKRRTLNSSKDVDMSLPTAEELARVPVPPEQNGWQVEHFWINPRPPVRLSHVPSYAHDIADAQLPLPQDISKKAKEKEEDPLPRRHKLIGDEADELDSSDIRALLERDAKRREQRDRERQERLDRKLRALDRPGRSRRRSSGKRRQDVDLDKAIEAGSSLAALQRPDLSRNSSSVHPALRDEPALPDETIGLGIGQTPENPFESPVITPQAADRELATPAELDTPFDDPVIQTAREVRMSTAITPPLSPVEGRRRSSIMAIEPLPPKASVTSLKSQPSTKRTTSVSKDRRAGAWASFFKRGDSVREASRPEMSFANHSRESMSKQMAPLSVITTRESAFQPTTSGIPQRKNSKFREDLPDAPLSPPDSRVQSPELPPNAAAIVAAAARHAQDDTQTGAQYARSDTPVSPLKAHGTMSASLASVDSEGSWLASGGSMKRASAQSGLSRSYGSLTRRTPEFNASFEELGASGDKDAEYIQRDAEAQRHARAQLNESALLEEEDTAPGAEANEPTVHEGVRRQPTLVHRDPAVRSREGLLSEFSAAEQTADDSAIKDDSADDEIVEVNQRTVRHVRQVSAGSAKVLDIAPRRISMTPASPTSPTTAAADQEAAKE